jgi:cell wall-associated NlpC family hydrolase
MSITPLGSVMPRRKGSVVLRRCVTMLSAALLGVTLALNPAAAPQADAAVSLSVSSAALRVAYAQRGIPYRYGGTTRAGFDCSGLTQYSYARVGRKLPRTAAQQYAATIHIPWNQRRYGDLVFFLSAGHVYHVAIYAGSWYIIAAPHSGTVVKKQKIWSNQILFGRVR